MATYYSQVNVLCENCQTGILDHYYTRCNNERCHAPFYHNRCIGVTSTERVINWLCNKCRHEYRSGDYSLRAPGPEPEMQHVAPHDTWSGIQIGSQPLVTQYVGPLGRQHARQQAPPPPNQQLGSQEDNQPTGQRAKVRTKRTINHNNDGSDAIPRPDINIASLSDEVLQLRREIAELNEQVANLNSSYSANNSRLDDVYTHMSAADDRIRNLEYWEIEVVTLRGQVTFLYDNLRNQVEFIGIPELYDEDLIEIVLTAAEKIGVELDETDIDWIFRSGSKKLTEAGKRFGRPIVLRFVRRIKRDEFLKAAKSKGILTTEDLNILCESKRIYINERLSREVRFLFHEARNRAKQANFKFCWTHNGSVYVRKREGYPAVRLLNHFDLIEKLGSCLNPRYRQYRRNQSENT